MGVAMKQDLSVFQSHLVAFMHIPYVPLAILSTGICEGCMSALQGLLLLQPIVKWSRSGVDPLPGPSDTFLMVWSANIGGHL